MHKKDYDIMHELEADFWWFVGMRDITRALLERHMTAPPRAVLDIGCGTGINITWMSRFFSPGLVVGCDFSGIALSWCRETMEKTTTETGVPRPLLSQGDVRKLPFGSGSFDLATILDVLDLFPPTGGDFEGFAELHRVLRPGGLAFVREPAYRWLLSSHDTVFETQHRYTTGELAGKMASAGFEIVQTTYANTLLFPLAAARRLLRKTIGLASDRTDSQPWPSWLKWLNGPFTMCLRAEADLISDGWRLPFGLSAICIGRKRT